MIIQNKYSEFIATNGVDVITGKYERGVKGPDGKFHPHWNLTSDTGVTETLYLGKPEVLDHVAQLLCRPTANTPFSEQEAERMQETEGSIHGIVAVELSEFASLDQEQMLDLLASRLTEAMITGPDYRVVGFDEQTGTTLYMRVSGQLGGEDWDE